MPRFLPSLLLALLVSACSDGDPCSQAPRCDDSEALNCETACTVGPCSTGAIFQECDQGTTCTVVPGDRSDARFYRSRAVCARSLTACDPATAPEPVCEDGRFVTGCGAHHRDIRAFCSQAALYFAKVPACCVTGPGDGGADAGTDGGTGDGGIPDAGPGPSDAGR
ncbi:hypothetical protein HUA76_17275 [Myxococcus sp. CA056]|uniref:hypothetical protein n=1 Tax=unclassified Myxococcus TaxID=2648731 RepID=UPI00157A9248|nr:MULTISPECIES: hypothetical protein [unclassified Myxococcus]NTX12551.1 hypothetical protein [Myxococcus sp. CA056]NTX33570.1 hypothetical protein [Myxococcus sp. CA033]